MNVLNNITVFLVDTLFSLYILVVMIRLLLGLSRADFHNPISQFVVTLTNPPLRPLRRVIPPIKSIDTAAIVLLLLLKFVQNTLLFILMGRSANPILVLYVSVFQLIELALYVYIFALIIQAVLSWVNPGAYMGGNPLGSILYSLTRPILEPLSPMVPRIGMVDITPLVAIILLNIGLIIVRAMY